ncbi:MAG: hypothetical protein ACRDCE_17520 [Cetobacterium sp.]|uniref:hypothetical protein n=1 Tax=Cetobacterium sp. TaxID=2071632 RepID=UPI003EE4BDC9
MDNVLKRINEVDALLPNPTLMSSSSTAISRAMDILRPVIVDERVVQFINSIRQQDMRTELLKIFWTANKDNGAEHHNLLNEGLNEGTGNMITNHTYLTSISFLLSSPGIPYPNMLEMFDGIERVYNETREDFIKAEAADIMNRFFPKRGIRMLDELRQQAREQQVVREQQAVEQQAAREQQAQTNRLNTRRFKQGVVYGDSQNVHNNTINESVISAARALIEEMVAAVTFDGRYKFIVFRNDTVKSISRKLADVLKRFPEDVTILGDQDNQELQLRMTYRISKGSKSTNENTNKSREDENVNEFLNEIFDDLFPDMNMDSFINRIKTGSVRDINLLELLNAVWKFIHTKRGETFTEMKKRLKEEILEGMGVCTTGVCARLVSVIQGYFDEDKKPHLKIKISLEDELKAKLTQNINVLAMKREVDPVMECDEFKKLVDEYIDTNAKEILEGFTDDDIRMNGLSKQMIIDVAYRVYMI